MDNRIVQPSSYKQIIKQSLHVYIASFKRVLLLSFLLSFIIFLPRIIALVSNKELFQHLAIFSIHRLWLVFLDFAALILFIGIVWRVHCFMVGKHEPLSEDLKIGSKRFLYVAVACILQSLLVFGFTAFLFALHIFFIKHHLFSNHHLIGLLFTTLLILAQIFLILYVFTLFLFFIPLITIENDGIIQSLECSVLLVWNHWWRVISAQYTPWVCYLIVLAILRYALRLDIYIYFVGQGPTHLSTVLLNILLFTLFIPWIPAMLLVQLRDLELNNKRNLPVAIDDK